MYLLFKKRYAYRCRKKSLNLKLKIFAFFLNVILVYGQKMEYLKVTVDLMGVCCNFSLNSIF